MKMSFPGNNLWRQRKQFSRNPQGGEKLERGEEGLMIMAPLLRIWGLLFSERSLQLSRITLRPTIACSRCCGGGRRRSGGKMVGINRRWGFGEREREGSNLLCLITATYPSYSYQSVSTFPVFIFIYFIIWFCEFWFLSFCVFSLSFALRQNKVYVWILSKLLWNK